MENESLLNSKNDIPQICNFNTSDAEIKFIHLNHEHQIEHRFPTCYTQFWIDNKMFSTINKNLEIALLEKWIPQIDVADAILLKRSPRPLTPRLEFKRIDLRVEKRNCVLRRNNFRFLMKDTQDFNGQ